MEYGDGIPNRRDVLGGHPTSFTPTESSLAKTSLIELEKHHKVKDPIGEEDYDPWVYEFSKDNLPALDRSVNRVDKPAEYGWHPSN